jgi:RNA polymerase sigma-70 factor (ECF subfamily)
MTTQPQRPEAWREEERALRSFQAGDPAGFETIARRYQDAVFRLALGLLGNRDDARDASQEVFLRALRQLPSFRFESRLSTWLYRVTLNVSREIRRRRNRERLKRHRWLLLVAPLLTGDAPGAEEGDRFSELLAMLPPRQKEVVVLRIVQELTIAEAAEVLGVPEGTVKGNLFKAVAKLRSKMRCSAPRRLTVAPCR